MNRIWSTEGMISYSIKVPIGLPQFSDSALAKALAFFSRSSAILSRASCRSEGVMPLQIGKAASAALNAAFTSAAEETGALA